jgi:hypothetical protein
MIQLTLYILSIATLITSLYVDSIARSRALLELGLWLQVGAGVWGLVPKFIEAIK